MPTPLESVCKRLETLSTLQTTVQYRIPALWIPPHTTGGVRLLRNPAAYYHSIVRSILEQPLSPQKQPTRESTGLIYLTYIRHTTAWDHDGSGTITYDLGTDHWRQTGTCLKLIALLPYLRWLGVTTLLLLPPTTHGRTHAKGTLGSPYAPQDHCTIEETLAEPILEEGATIEFAALVEACHRLGMQVIVELAMRVASLDCPLIAHHPDWFYWVREDVPQPLRPPHFLPEQVTQIKEAVERRDFSELPPPPPEYRAQFVEPPQRVLQRSDGLFVGETTSGERCIVPSVFADYPPDDNQPLWTDITYFRLHTHSHCNYIAYDTVRYYRPELEGSENTALCNYIASVIPRWIERFHVDGVLLDMGHAFPPSLHRAIIENARRSQPDLIMIEESFDRSDPSIRQLGYDLVVGDVWHWSSSIASLQHFSRTHAPKSRNRYLASPDTHNTPRIASRGICTALYAFAVCSQLPGGVPLITSGSELGECEPINTGLGFSADDIAHYPPERLPLFSGRTLRWDHPDWEILEFIGSIYGRKAH